ncbi:MAG: PID-CTERM protein-sorting domain-containing protein [Janthinobacterium lividum]
MKYSLFIATCLVVVGLANPAAHAQAPDSGGPAPTPLADPTAVPLDGGASLLLASGVAYGLRRLRQRRQRA